MASKINLSPPMASAADRSKAVNLLLFVYGLMLLLLFVGFSCLVLVLLNSTLCPLKFCNHLAGEERAGYFTFIVFLVSCGCYCSLPLPKRAVGWSAVCFESYFDI